MPLPPLAEQQRIVEILERVDSVVAQTAVDVASKLRQVQRLRHSILKWAFEGKLVDQDPNDEPAEALLARIKAERETATPSKKARGRKSKTS